MRWFAIGLATLLGGAASVQAQAPMVLPPPAAWPWTVNYFSPGDWMIRPTAGFFQAAEPEPIAPPKNGDALKPMPAATLPPAGSSCCTSPACGGSACGKNPCCDDGPPWGPTAPEDVNLFGCNRGCGGTRVYGWLDAGYTYASVGPGLLNVETRENRFGDELLLNQAAIVLEKPLQGGHEFSWGYNATFYAGADAALLRPEGGIDRTDDPRWGYDFRQLYLSAHLPVLTEGGMDVKFGRQGTIIGYESALAPYRPFYSNDYQWFYSEDGAWTGLLTNLHVNKQLDVLNGVTMGANTFFTFRGDAPTYIGQINYWLQESRKTLISLGTQQGNQAIFSATPPGSWIGTYEVRLQQQWSKRLFQVVQTNFGWEYSVPQLGTVNWGGVYNMFIYQLTPKLGTGIRTEWFDDPQGSRIGVPGNYEEITWNVDYHPYKWVSIRPEVRGDFNSNVNAFGVGDPPNQRLNRSQLTAAVDLLLKY
jgi:hypothetical protein